MKNHFRRKLIFNNKQKLFKNIDTPIKNLKGNIKKEYLRLPVLLQPNIIIDFKASQFFKI